jgi:hypothetical protein
VTHDDAHADLDVGGTGVRLRRRKRYVLAKTGSMIAWRRA